MENYPIDFNPMIDCCSGDDPKCPYHRAEADDLDESDQFDPEK